MNERLKEAYSKLKQLEEFFNSGMKRQVKSDLSTLKGMNNEQLDLALLTINQQYLIFSKIKGFNSAEKEIEKMQEELEKAFPVFKIK